jgi:hypothetical protein
MRQGWPRKVSEGATKLTARLWDWVKVGADKDVPELPVGQNTVAVVKTCCLLLWPKQKAVKCLDLI